MNNPIYKRLLLKLSGEAFKGKKEFGFDNPTISDLADEIAAIHLVGAEIGIVIGGGNIFRGGKSVFPNLHRAVADYIGMTATVINALVLQGALQDKGIPAQVMSALEAGRIIRPFNRARAIEFLENKNIVIFAGGTGNPFFTTDSAAVLRAVEMNAEVVLKGTNVKGVYSADPRKDENAEFFPELSFDEVIKRNLKVMDSTAFTMARDNELPIIVFNINEKGNLAKIINDEKIGTIVK